MTPSAYYTSLWLVLAALAGCAKSSVTPTEKPAVVVSAAGDIGPSVESFRQLLGDPLNTTPGRRSGRREINWDAVPDQFINTNLPANFFSVTAAGDPDSRKRGFAYAAAGDFRVSNNNFANIEPSLSGEIAAFSGDRVFANTSSFQWDVTFFVPGTLEPAAVTGFGAVFSDVDLSNTSGIELFAGDSSLGKFYASPRTAAGGLSFVGAFFETALVTRVRVSHGNGLIVPGQKDISAGGSKDIVAMDDFIYGEPIPLR